jgi:nitrite reductase (NO-forming)
LSLTNKYQIYRDYVFKITITFATENFNSHINRLIMKKLSILFVLAAFGLAISMTSCGGGSEQAAAPAADTTAKADTVAAGPDYSKLPAEVQAMMPRGKEIYDTKCFACHQKDGKGLENMYPPLAQSDYLLADKLRAVEQTLNGSHFEMTVNGKVYNAEMPAQLTTVEDAVASINYVLNNFGNDGGYITMEDAKNIKVKPAKKK